MKTTLDYALAYAKNKIPVLPLHYIKENGECSCGGIEKNPKCKLGKHPFSRLVTHGVKDASTDENKISSWFNQKPYNIGVATGDVSGFFVLDRDDKDGGESTLAAWEKEYGPLPKTLIQRTGNGFHYFFRMPQGLDIRNTQKSSSAPGIDIRGNGGYICAAPSKHYSGRNYELLDSDTISLENIAEAPSWLIDKIVKPTPMLHSTPLPISKLTADLSVDTFYVPSKVTDGEGRESFLIRYAGHLRANGYSQQAIENTLLLYNRDCIEPPLDEALVIDKARRYASDLQQELLVNDDAWPVLEKLADKLPEIPTFNLGLLPRSVEDLVCDISNRICCPVEYPAVSVMVALGAAIGSRIHCKPYKNSSWLVPANVWGILCGHPSQQKSPSVTEALKPLKILDKEAADKYELELQQFALDMGIYDKSLKAAIKAGNGTLPIAKPLEPKMTRYVVNDTTYEKLIEITKANPPGILIWRDELASWFYSMDKDNQKEARGLYLTGWSGTEGYATDRIGRGHVRADLVTISILGTIQPDVLKTVIFDAVSGGAGNDGLAQRFQLAVYPDPVRTFKKPQGYPNFKAMKDYENKIRELSSLDLNKVGAEVGLDGVPYLLFDDFAQVAFDNWREKLELRLRGTDSDEHPVVIAHLGKYRSLVPKLALIIHLADGNTGAINLQSTKKAIAWTMLLEAHAKRMYYTTINRAVKSAASLSNKIKAGKLKNGFTRTDVLLASWADLRTAEDITTALAILKDKGWLQAYEEKRTGGRPSEKFYINPQIKRAA